MKFLSSSEMKSGRLTFVALLASYLYCVGFASFLHFASYEVTSGWYALFILLLGFCSAFGLLAWAIVYSRIYPNAPRLVGYGLSASFLYLIVIGSRPFVQN